MSNQNFYVALDRDGTIIEDKHYLSDPGQVFLLPGAAKALAGLGDLGLVLLVVTNQSGIGRGYFSVEDMHAVNAKLDSMLEEYGVEIRGYYYCPHAPGDGCDCRKPLPGLIHSACEDLGLDPDKGFVVGDKCSDIGLGLNVGAKTVLVRTGYGVAQEAENRCKPDFIGDDLIQAAEFIKKVISSSRLD